MIVDTKKRSTRYNSDKYHTAYGIQKWLCGKGFCLKEGAKYKVDKEEYKALLKAFIIHERPNFDFSKLKHGIESMENIIQKDFSKFCTFTCNYMKNK